MMVLKITNFAHHKEELIEDELFFNAYFVDIGGLKGTTHFEYDAKRNKMMMRKFSEIKSKSLFLFK
jgi:hypothetical protein